MSTVIFVLVAVFAHVAALPAPASHPGDAAAKAKAQVLLRQGTALFEAGDHAGALEEFQAEYFVFPSPKLWFNIGEAERKLGQDVEAVDAFERFLADASDAPGQSSTEALQSVSELKARLGRIAVECRPAGCDVRLDGKRVGETPLSKPAWVMPGKHQVEVRHAGLPSVMQVVEVRAGAVRNLSLDVRPIDRQVDLTATAPAAVTVPSPMVTPVTGDVSIPATADDRSSMTHRWWFWAAIGTAAVLGIGIIAVKSLPSFP